MIIFKNRNIEEALQSILNNNQSVNVDSRVAVDFLNYLKINNIDLTISDEEFINLTTASAIYNNRKNITQADLFTILHLDLKPELIESLTNCIQETMFFEINQNINNNSDFKDVLIEKLNSNKISESEIKDLEKILIWVPQQNKINDDLLENLKSNPQLCSKFDQEMILDLVRSWVMEKNKILKFQNYSFGLILEKIKAK
ncbi:hypothetical protein [Spiroplasma alleghenense]|uniref:Uncharacterized protein n=1 Tax=Spiroplasma alleghenense TaxID=216931 RepID=A0A345Z4B8_9MOLU|nr:hypothetical protein [Spiroplasma alleghenense]AXK51447.1 hypothetical protein SALLE_v1c07770 [Spiroplasma alleghenense]